MPRVLASIAHAELAALTLPDGPEWATMANVARPLGQLVVRLDHDERLYAGAGEVFFQAIWRVGLLGALVSLVSASWIKGNSPGRVACA